MRTPVVAAITIALTLAGCGGDQRGAEPAPSQTGPPDDSIQVVGTNGLEFDPERLAATAGEVTIELTSEPSVRHNIVIEGVAEEEPVVEAAAGATATSTVELGAGSYTFYCSVPGHRQAGMQGSLEVVTN